MKRRSICYSRDIAKKGTNVLVDRRSEIERRAARVTVTELKEKLKSVSIGWFGWSGRRQAWAQPTMVPNSRHAHCILYGRPILL